MNCIRIAEVKLLQADMATDDARAALLAEAKDVLVRAEMTQPGAGSWKLACVSARMGSRELCLKWLERGKRHGALPEPSEIEEHPHFEKVRGQKWFRRFLDSLS